jgi:hypothetical protein
LIRKTIGPKRAVEALFKSSMSPKWARYAMHGLDHGVVYLNLDNETARLLAESSHCSKPWARRQARSANGKTQESGKVNPDFSGCDWAGLRACPFNYVLTPIRAVVSVSWLQDLLPYVVSIAP